MIGAHSLRSVVRRALFPEVRLRYSGQTSYRGVAAFRRPDKQEGTAWEVWGKGCRFGFSAIAEEEVYWFATLDAPPDGIDAPGEGRTQLETLSVSFPGPIPALIRATPPEAITRTGMYDFPPMRSWHAGRVVLVGDAAHATTPNLDQGGAQAIEDAYVLAEKLATYE